MKFDVDCGVRTSFGLLVQNKKLEKNIALSDSQQSELMKYINDIIKLQFMEKKISHSGIAFSLTNTTGSLTIFNFGNQPVFLNQYNNLMTFLQLPKVIIESR